MALLEVDSLVKHFPGPRGRTVKAVDGVTFSLERGQVLGLVGESGCGKSTLSRLILQLLPPTSGRVLLEGECLSSLPPAVVRRRRLDFQMVFQDPYASLNPRLTVFSTLSEAIAARHPGMAGNRTACTEAVAALMRRVGLDARAMRKYPHEFSGGQRQRIAIARALAPEPRLIIADEPVSALDVSIQSQILNLLQGLVCDLGLTMIFVSHDLSVVKYIADDITVMYQGKLVETGPAEEVFHHPRESYTRRLLEAVPRIRFGGDRFSSG
ncbi:MAG: ABC transporter ATP-binding protein [Verrucomicrobiae bacterium]|nr:ABC transporter ATP-binding protein [Verrucomicrobiae bacterium]